MPSDFTLYTLGVWLLVGACVGFGWAFGAWLFGKITK